VAGVVEAGHSSTAQVEAARAAALATALAQRAAQAAEVGVLGTPLKSLMSFKTLLKLLWISRTNGH
jgi:hypothetical protein